MPDFSSNNTGWVSIGTDWVAVPGSPPPVTDDSAHPYVPNNTGRQPTFRVADVNNPNLTQFAKDELKKSNDEVLRVKAMYARESRCWATGVPTYLLNPAQPTFVLQAPDRVAFQSLLFSKIVPNCKKLGLLDAGDGWLRTKFTELGCIQFEDMPDTGEEYDMFALANGEQLSA